MNVALQNRKIQPSRIGRLGHYLVYFYIGGVWEMKYCKRFKRVITL